MSASNPIDADNVDDDEDSIDEEQLGEYEEMVQELGGYPVSGVPKSFSNVGKCQILPFFSL